jgi:hypothetical protein
LDSKGDGVRLRCEEKQGGDADERES